MKAVYLSNPLEVSLVDVKKPEPKEGFALIKVKSASICGSDVGAFRGSNVLVNYPIILGHEVAGEVVSIGENPKGIKVGDRVILDPYIYCGKCYPCSIGRTNCCENLNVLGVHVDGGMVELFSHPQELLNKVPDSIPWSLVPLAEPLTIALHSVHRGGLKEGEYVTIIGAGPIGLLSALVALHYKAIPILIDILDERLSYAKTLGINNVINAKDDNPLEVINNITKGVMSQVIIEASGSNKAIRDSFDYVSYAGRIVFTGWPKSDTEIPTAMITKKELDVRGSRTSANEFEEALDLIVNNKVDVKSIISKVVNFDDLPQSLIDMSNNPEKFLKIVALMD